MNPALSSLPRILFVDDDVRVLEGLRRALLNRQSVWQMTFARGPEEALALARETPFDVVVADMAMPGMNGLTLLIALRRIMPQAVSIVLTGTADLRCAIDAINQAGVFRFYTKPCPSFLLREGITAALEQRRSLAPGSAPALAPATATGTAGAAGGGTSSGDNGTTPRTVDSAASPSVVGEAPLDLLSLGVVVVDVTGRVRFSNRRGSELCQSSDGLTLEAGRVCHAELPAEDARLHQLIRDAIAGGDSGAVLITRSSAKRPLSVLVAPVPAANPPSGSETASSATESYRSAALLISDPEDIALPSPEQLEALFDLPPMKARIAYYLSQGHTLAETADLLGITYGTARTYLKDIFVRTGTGRQSELIKLIMTQPQVMFDVRGG